MARRVFYSFHYALDAWRVAQVKNIGVVEGQPILSANDWEDVAAGGDKAIENWINDNMRGTSCNIVLIGSRTAGRRWVEYEFKKAWSDGRGVLGINIHNLQNANKQTSPKGANPFAGFTIKQGTVKLESVVPVYDPPGVTSSEVYKSISDNIEALVERAIAARQKW